VSLVIHDAGGRFVKEIRRGQEGTGTYAVEWDGRDDAGAPAPAGVYFCTLRVGAAGLTRKMVLLP